METVEVTIENVNDRLSAFIWDYWSKYRRKPTAIALGPNEYLSLCIELKNVQRIIERSSNGYCLVHGVSILIAPINGIMALGCDDDKHEIIEEKRRGITDLN